MTEREAIEELKYDCEQLGKSIPCDTSWGQAINIAYGMAISALEKQIPKKPIKVDSGVYDYDFDYECPNCRGNIDEDEHHCKCGQTLDWSEE